MPFRTTGPLPQIQVPGHSGKALESGTSAAQPAGEAGTKTGTAPKTAPSAPVQAADAPAPAPVAETPAPEPEPQPELAVVSAAAAAGSMNGHGAYGATTTASVTAPSPENLRSLVIDILERRHGDVAATLAEVRAEGYGCDEAEIQRISDNHWFPYAVYRLLAKHHGDGDLVAQELTSQGIAYDQTTLDALVQSWRV
jgi:hypothetical protein